MTKLPFAISWRLYRAGEFLAVVLIAIYAFMKGKSIHGNTYEGLFCTAAALSVGIATWGIVATDNYGLYITIATIGLIESSRRRLDWLAGIMLALLMIKPQVGALFVIPLLMKLKWKTVLMAVLICLLASIPPSLWLHVTPVELILEIPKYGSDVAHGTLLLPRPLFIALEPMIGQTWLIAITALAGVAICLLVTWRVRNYEDGVRLYVPAILCASLWTYSSSHDHWTWAIVQIALASDLIRRPKGMHRAIVCSTIIFLSGSFCMIFHQKSTNTWVETIGANCMGGKAGKALFALYLLLTLVGVFETFFWLWIRWCNETTRREPTNRRDDEE